MKTKLTLLIAACFAAGVSDATLLMYEGMDYSNGTSLSDSTPFNGTVDGTTVTAGTYDVTFGDPNEVQTGSLSFTGLQTSGNKATTTTQTTITASNISVDLTTSSALDSGTQYASFLFNLTDMGTLGTSNSNELFAFAGTRWEGTVRQDSGNSSQYNIGFGWRSDGGQIYSGALDTGTTYLVVVANDFSSGTHSLWVDPASLGGTAPAASVTGSNNTTNAWDRFAFYSVFDGDTSGTGTGAYEFDELRIGTTWASVTPVPEPGTLALTVLAAGALGLSVFRRRG